MRDTKNVLPLLLTLLLALPLGACGDDNDDDNGMEPTGSYSLTFTGDASFQGAHGGQAIHAAVVRAGSGAVEAMQSGTVSSDSDPAFSFTFQDVLEAGAQYEVHYWIDSNFMGGAVGTCDGPEDDHQWSVAVGTVTADVTIDDTHRPTETESVCNTFQ